MRLSQHRRVLLDGAGTVTVECWPAASLLQAGANEVLVAPDRVGLCRTDLELCDGSMAYLRSGEATLPIVPGHEWTGRVVAVGPGVPDFKPGTRVVGEPHLNCGVCPTCRAGQAPLCPYRREVGIMHHDGAMATRLLVPAASLHALPTAVGPSDAALLEPLSVAVHAVQCVGPIDDGPVAIVGCGTIGCLVVMVCVAAGLPVCATDVRVDRVDLARLLGAQQADHSTRYPVVIDASGSAQGLNAALHLLRPRGRLVLLGLTGRPFIEVPIDEVVVNSQTLVGSLGSGGLWPEAIDLVVSGIIAPSRLVTHEFTLDEAGRAFHLLRSGRQDVGKILIHVNAP